MERIDIRLLLNKLKSKTDRINFLREMGFIMPNDKGFDVKFFIQVLKGEKELLRIGQFGGVDFPWFTRSNNFTKNHLLSYFHNDQKLKRFVPDDINLLSIKRSYLLNVSHLLIFQILFNVRRDIYNQLYMKYKMIKGARENTKWNGYYINVAEGLNNTIEQYKPINNTQKNLRPFRLSKKGVALNLFSHLLHEEQIENNIPKIGYVPNINLHNEHDEINDMENNKINIEPNDEQNMENQSINLMNSMMANQPNNVK